MSAAAVNSQQMVETDGRDTAQIVVTNNQLTLAIDSMGQEIWTMANSGRSMWTEASFASGDVDGDGAPDWAFLERREAIGLISAKGERLAVVPVQTGLAGFGILTSPMQRGLLITLAAGKVTAYQFER